MAENLSPATGSDAPSSDGFSREDPPGLPLEALAGFMASSAPGTLDGELEARVIAGGRSNLTYAVRDTHGRSVVVRRPPLGHVLATAHDMVREHRVISALGGTDVPVPTCLAVDPEGEVIGAPFYVMDLVPGTPFRRAAELERLGAERTTAICERMIDTLVALHAVDPQQVGLVDFGRPDGYLARQVRRWGKQLEASRSRDLMGADELLEWLGEHVPERSDAAIVHGDFRLDNLLVDTDVGDRVAAVLDWEMATLGDPLSDVGLLTVYQQLAVMRLGGPVSDAPLAPGYPPIGDLLERYARGSGRDLGVLDFHTALAYFKLAVILEGIHYRHTQGKTVGKGFGDLGNAVEPLLAAGLRAAHGETN